MGVLMVCLEAGVEVMDAFGRELCVLDPEVHLIDGHGKIASSHLVKALNEVEKSPWEGWPLDTPKHPNNRPNPKWVLNSQPA